MGAIADERSHGSDRLNALVGQACTDCAPGADCLRAALLKLIKASA